ncbi:LOW QUALITY PROTEIN: hypothetical protein V2J09_023479 [Rumex salicifolius]
MEVFLSSFFFCPKPKTPDFDEPRREQTETMRRGVTRTFAESLHSSVTVPWTAIEAAWTTGASPEALNHNLPR